MSDETRNEKRKVPDLVNYFANLNSSEGPKGRCYGETDRDKIREQYNRNHVPTKTARLEEEIPIIKPRRMHQKSSRPDVAPGHGPEDEDIEEMSTVSSTGGLEEFDEAASPNNSSPRTPPTGDEIEELSDAQSEFETSPLIVEAEDGKIEEHEHMIPRKTTAHNGFQDQLRKVKEEKNKKIEQLDKIISRETTTRNGSQDELTKLKEDLKSKEEQIAELKEEVQQLSSRQELITWRLMSEIRNLQSQVDSLTDEKEAQLKEMQRLRETVAEKDDIIHRMTKERDEYKRERDECISTLEKERDKARREKEAMAEQARQAELAHLQELHEQGCRQYREAHELMQAQKIQALRDECESQVPDTRSEFYRERRRGAGLDHDSDDFARREFIDDCRKEQLLQEQERNARLQEELRRLEEQRMHLGVMQQARLYQQPQFTPQKQLTGVFDDNFASSPGGSSRTHRRGKSGESGKTMKMSRPKRDRTKMSVTKR